MNSRKKIGLIAGAVIALFLAAGIGISAVRTGKEQRTKIEMEQTVKADSQSSEVKTVTAEPDPPSDLKDEIPRQVSAPADPDAGPAAGQTDSAGERGQDTDKAALPADGFQRPAPETENRPEALGQTETKGQAAPEVIDKTEEYTDTDSDEPADPGDLLDSDTRTETEDRPDPAYPTETEDFNDSEENSDEDRRDQDSPDPGSAVLPPDDLQEEDTERQKPTEPGVQPETVEPADSSGRSGTEDNTSSSLRPGTEDNTGSGARPGTEDNTGSSVRSGTEDNTSSGARPGTEGNTGSGVQPGTEDNTGSGSQPGTEDNTGSGSQPGTEHQDPADSVSHVEPENPTGPAEDWENGEQNSSGEQNGESEYRDEIREREKNELPIVFF